MCLDVGNKFSIISPTHDFKIVTRLQHVTQPLWAMSSAAEKNRMAETFLGQWRRRQLMSSVHLFADCIENGHMPADLHGFMTMAPFKNVNPSVAVCWNWRGNCQPNCTSLGHRDQNAMVLDEVIHDDLSKRINNENEYSGGAWAGKRNVARVGGILT